MRKVAGSYKAYDGGTWQQVSFDNADFHCWGVQSEELEVGALVDTVAIVELPDGRIITPIPNDILFLDRKDGGVNV